MEDYKRPRRKVAWVVLTVFFVVTAIIVPLAIRGCAGRRPAGWTSGDALDIRLAAVCPAVRHAPAGHYRGCDESAERDLMEEGV